MKSVLVNCLRPAMDPILAGIRKYKDIHKGESCYLFGDGVSIKWFDLGTFSDKQGIVCGFLPFHNDFSRLHSEYFILIEPWWFYPFQRTTSPPVKFVQNHLQKLYRKHVIEKYTDKTVFTNISNYPVLYNKNICYTFRDIIDVSLTDNFISHQMNCFAGSLRASILIAIYLGFDHCHLVGFDYTHFPSKSRHWYEKGMGLVNDLKYHEQDFLELAKQFIDITTITLDAGSNTLNHITYKAHTGLDPVFKENTEILTRKYLNIFNKWPGYTIF